MRTFASLEGLPVIDRQTGNELGSVMDGIIAPDRMMGFLVNKNGWFHRHQWLPLDHIISLGTDGVMIEAKGLSKEISTNGGAAYPLMHGQHKLQGKPLITEEGERLGLVQDVYFLEKAGKIVAYEVTEGLLADITEGRKVVRSNGPVTVGKDVLIVSM
ncbi:PRC-barrel domain-containing protein [Halalkalibacterium halodurans]|uniref:BH1264 protein n=2 Tax=Halalkalibacterium halodurans TaxID=86665 RepID=Q9KDE9_HALH5|nr:PRC-barrel domain-containing protein [Halalkalibacterium halodurans]MDY7221789.1 PRC-barrel domain-containing protein [Halalkalibacterium halodurans]MDY7241065.1 PRC-barrel domain-containing protein [Halalkalibacterium halodurans]MED3645407.1 PRC-barrel domain-containing protein [Halalkalibacterium halodurans]MED4081886.1 PRC-barrel domain-containing protein [Halalkalibacterium halodurans]MED4086012.1 PRC-barrel domain-containing protein [Halalkalibacterium halodurans]